MRSLFSSKPSFLLLIVFIVLPFLGLGQDPWGMESIPTATAEPIEFFSLALGRFDLHFFIRMAVDLLAMFILIRFIYYPVYGRYDFFFTFFMFNIIILIITTLLNNNSGFGVGAAFGLFAIFSILRYRTEDITARDMTYLFISITLGLIASLTEGSILEIGLMNLVILIMAFLVEGNVFVQTGFVKTIEYERIELIKPEHRAELKADIQARTGLIVHKLYIKKIDFLRDTATIKVYYHSKQDNDA